MKENISNILACPECLKELSYYENYGQCTQCQVEYPLMNGVIFFNRVENNIIPDGVKYAKNKTSWSSFKKRNYSFIQNAVKKMPPESVILDIGAGPGFFNELFDTFKKYYSLDFYNYPNIDIVSNIIKKNIPIRSSSIHYIILSNVLEHISKPDKLLLECSRILHSGGTLIIIVPFIFKIHQAPYDYYRYTHYKLNEMLAECDFTNIEIKKMGTITEVLNGIKYEFKGILRRNTQHQFLLNQFLRLQYYVDTIINKLFLKLDDEQLTNEDIFTGYSCTAVKK